jgi:hypothetical protein
MGLRKEAVLYVHYIGAMIADSVVCWLVSGAHARLPSVHAVQQVMFRSLLNPEIPAIKRRQLRQKVVERQGSQPAALMDRSIRVVGSPNDGIEQPRRPELSSLAHPKPGVHCFFCCCALHAVQIMGVSSGKVVPRTGSFAIADRSRDPGTVCATNFGLAATSRDEHDGRFMPVIDNFKAR